MSCRLGVILILTLLVSACVNSTIDEMVLLPSEQFVSGRSIVILGRRHSSDYETEPDFVQCVGKHISARSESIRVIDEQVFVDSLYPWFEARTAPLRLQHLERLLERPAVRDSITAMGTRFIIWIDGSTQTSDEVGSVACGIGAGGAGCFGFGTWNSDAHYEATIWNFDDLDRAGRITADASGQSYMPAVVLPIPIIAPVQSSACEGLGSQLLQFLNPENGK
jgi:hypothetical protein